MGNGGAPTVQTCEGLAFTLSEKGLSGSRCGQTFWALCGEQTVGRPEEKLLSEEKIVAIQERDMMVACFMVETEGVVRGGWK